MKNKVPVFQDHKAVVTWLMFTAFMVFAMAIIGAITRLTESGLSMVEWRPLLGAMPPLNESEWNRVYELYKQSPEFEHKHNWMGIDDFKRIFFWEWFHRLWGRLIGLVFTVPLIIFAIKRKIPAGYGLKLVGLFILGGTQGLVGWWMVKSGLINNPDVSHYRLAVHLSLAFIIFAALIWVIMDFFPDRKGDILRLRTLGFISIGSLSGTIIWGAFVAGLEAGMIYNTFPHMNNSFTPSTDFNISSIIEKRGWVQFTHRWVAIFTGLVLFLYAYKKQSPLLGAMVFLQIGLGIATLLTQLWIPLAALHQAGAFILVALLVITFRNKQIFRRL